jgi:hypothetical protein
LPLISLSKEYYEKKQNQKNNINRIDINNIKITDEQKLDFDKNTSILFNTEDNIKYINFDQNPLDTIDYLNTIDNQTKKIEIKNIYKNKKTNGKKTKSKNKLYITSTFDDKSSCIYLFLFF